MAEAQIHRLKKLPAMIREFEHILSETSTDLLKEFQHEVKSMDKGDLGAERVQRLRQYLYSFKRDLDKDKYKSAGKDLEKVLDVIEELEEQLGHH